MALQCLRHHRRWQPALPLCLPVQLPSSVHKGKIVCVCVCVSTTAKANPPAPNEWHPYLLLLLVELGKCAQEHTQFSSRSLQRWEPCQQLALFGVRGPAGRLACTDRCGSLQFLVQGAHTLGDSGYKGVWNTRQKLRLGDCVSGGKERGRKEKGGSVSWAGDKHDRDAMQKRKEMMTYHLG